jgi:hypothetical protein
MKTKILALSLLILTGCNPATNPGKSDTQNIKDWALLNFVKTDSINPIMEPSAGQKFFCPLTKKEIQWEERNVLNPSAVVKDDKVYMIYRAQDRK